MSDALELLALRVNDLNLAYTKQSAMIVHLEACIADLESRFEERVSRLEFSTGNI